MPVDKPKAGESRDNYLNYCIPIEVEAGKEVDQAAAICNSYYDKDKMKAIKDTSSKLRLSVSNSISTNTGVNPSCRIGLMVVGNPAIGVNTLVPLGKFIPRLDVKAANINKLALEPLLVKIPNFLPKRLGKRDSKRIPSWFNTSQPPNKVLTAATYSFSSK